MSSTLRFTKDGELSENGEVQIPNIKILNGGDFGEIKHAL